MIVVVTNETPPMAVVLAMYQRLGSGDVAGARAM
jgi:hypothetical protein